ncbi:MULTISPECIES: type I-E CRISPR-associated protein Cse2/CasB [Actinoalloteichus]|uniref:CRISPR type I-E/ECOLI-associated protein CasB/Cse2 n=1 Tax=Actinoalloteichus fjordicus TaxID=1612552 RepID=A0AAC9PTG9_9PSEU|nr:MULTISPECIES: type I-E CRISPR-associated protein Cse2/CasB [Actinoalloteichus]APU16654.1 CRISPR type I-E/ECOLI-associated protein CasB/Cse2 [Actinoalloteichus fjordicus]APU22720.1 CRISPR type I-E/ECOLI-associated protein CasB/Cse2 [Actinoalloteichus sp. GBA129-24]
MIRTQPSREVREEFVAHVLRLCAESTRVRSALRACAGRRPERMAPEVHAAVTRRLPPHASPGTEQAFYTIAGLIAARPWTTTPDQAGGPGSPGAIGLVAVSERGTTEPRALDVRTVDARVADATATALLPAARRPGAVPASFDHVRFEPVSFAPAIEQSAAPYPAAPHHPDLGHALARATVAGRGERRPMPVSNAEKHLHLLSRQGLTGIHRHLPAVVRRLHDLDQQIDWSRLLADLLTWEDEPRMVARRWLQSFYRTLPRDIHPASQEAER